MKKILIIINSIKKWGWAENVATNIWNELYKKWYNINYFTFYNDKNNILIKWNYFSLNEKISNNIAINIYKLIYRSYKIKKYCSKNNIDICISHLDEANFSNILSKVIFRNKSKIIIEIHNSIEKSLSNFYKFIYKMIINYTDKIISLTKEDIINFINILGAKKNKIINIYNPIDIKKITLLKEENVEEIEIFNNEFTFINIWRLSNQKNQILLIKAFNQFNKLYKNTKLIILWEWPLEKILKKESEKNKNIIFLWNKNNPYKYLSKSNYLIMTSIYEWLPVVQIESLACNIPVISSNCKTWPKEILLNDFNNIKNKEVNKIINWDCWILFQNWNIKQLIKVMILAYNNKNISKNMKTNIHNKVKLFQIENIIKKWIKIIEE